MFRQDGRYHRQAQDAVVVVPDDLIGGSDTARLLGVDRSTVNRMIHAGKLHPLAQLDGPNGAFVLDRLEVLELLQARAREGKTK